MKGSDAVSWVLTQECGSPRGRTAATQLGHWIRHVAIVRLRLLELEWRASTNPRIALRLGAPLAGPPRRTPPEALRGHQSQEACGLAYWTGLRCGVIGPKTFPSSKASLSSRLRGQIYAVKIGKGEWNGNFAMGLLSQPVSPGLVLPCVIISAGLALLETRLFLSGVRPNQPCCLPNVSATTPPAVKSCSSVFLLIVLLEHNAQQRPCQARW